MHHNQNEREATECHGLWCRRLFPHKWSTAVLVSQVCLHPRAGRISKDAWHSPYRKHRWVCSFYLLTGKLEPELCLMGFLALSKAAQSRPVVALMYRLLMRTLKKAAGKLNNLLMAFWPPLRGLLGRGILNGIKPEPRYHQICEISTLPFSLLWHQFLLILNSGWVAIGKAVSSV